MTSDVDVANSASVFDIPINVKWIACVCVCVGRARTHTPPIVSNWRAFDVRTCDDDVSSRISFFIRIRVDTHTHFFRPFHCYHCWQWMCSAANELQRLVALALPYHDSVWTKFNSVVRSNDFCSSRLALVDFMYFHSARSVDIVVHFFSPMSDKNCVDKYFRLLFVRSS